MSNLGRISSWCVVFVSFASFWIGACAGPGAEAAPRAAPVSAPTLAQPVREHGRIVVAVLVDGLSGGMVERFETTHLDRLRDEGTWSHRLEPTFPAISGPTWVSLSTGCWPEHHGIVTDKFLDPSLGLMDHSTDPRWLAGCELMQTVAERQGVRTAALGWWGQWSSDRGATATYVSSRAVAEASTPRDSLLYASDEERAAEVEHYLRLPTGERPRLILAYFRGPDHATHFAGMDSAESASAVRAFDAALGRVLDAIEALPADQPATLIVASDHGMVPVDRIVNVGRILRRHDIDARAVTTGTTAFLYFALDSDGALETPAQRAARIEAAYRALLAYDELDVWRKQEIPEFARLGADPRVPELVVAAKPGLYTADPDLWPWFLRPLGVVGNDFLPSPLLGAGLRAAHGYAPGTAGNDGVFYAWARDLPALGELASVRMIDVHPTIARLLGIESGVPVDGSAIEALLPGS